MALRRILVAEDSEDDIFLLKRAFRKAKLRADIHFVADGQEAIDYLCGTGEFSKRESFPLPSMLLVDLKMPRRNGFDVIAWVREKPGVRLLPVVVLSSSAEPRDVERAYDLGANSYLVKPSDLDDLEKIAEKVGDYWCCVNLAPPIDAPPGSEKPKSRHKTSH